jgi:hypothetical protein
MERHGACLTRVPLGVVSDGSDRRLQIQLIRRAHSPASIVSKSAALTLQRRAKQAREVR